MKHLILQDNELSYMVYYTPKKKSLMYETIYKSQQSFWKSLKTIGKKESGIRLLNYISQWLNAQGFKIVDITKELENKINVYNDLDIDSLMYRGVKIVQSQYGFSFYLNNSAKSFVSVLSIDDAIKMIDKELE